MSNPMLDNVEEVSVRLPGENRNGSPSMLLDYWNGAKWVSSPSLHYDGKYDLVYFGGGEHFQVTMLPLLAQGGITGQACLNKAMLGVPWAQIDAALDFFGLDQTNKLRTIAYMNTQRKDYRR